VYPQCLAVPGERPHLLSWVSDVPEPVGIAVGCGMLSPSELAVLEDAALGLTVAETAVKRHKSPETVKTQRRSVLLKLGARNVAQAVAMMIVGDSPEALLERRVA
jgi:DNA-binding NarL/FixJ family response regulator